MRRATKRPVAASARRKNSAPSAPSCAASTPATWSARTSWSTAGPIRGRCRPPARLSALCEHVFQRVRILFPPHRIVDEVVMDVDEYPEQEELRAVLGMVIGDVEIGQQRQQPETEQAQHESRAEEPNEARCVAA